MRSKFFLVTGGTGFLGSALVRRLLIDGHRVRVLDDNSRGNCRRLNGVIGDLEFLQADIRDATAVSRAVKGIDSVCHLAYVNGTEHFYTRPGQIVDIAVNGMLNVLNACRDHGVEELFLASSSEVYQNPPRVPTPENTPLTIGDLMNPRCSYGGGKIVSELLAVYYAADWLSRLVIFRPHNVYGPDMGGEHVIPQLALRMRDLAKSGLNPFDFPIQGTGAETRAFVHVDDFTESVAILIRQGRHREIYHLGNDEEVSIAALTRLIAKQFDRAIRLVAGPLLHGSPKRRCPDLAKIRSLGFRPKIPLASGLPGVIDWYIQNSHLCDPIKTQTYHSAA